MSKNYSHEEQLILLNHIRKLIAESTANYHKDVEELHHDNEYIELISPSSQKAYDHLKKIILKANITDDKKRSEATLGDLKYHLTKALTNIFGEEYADDIKYFRRKIKPIRYPIVCDCIIEWKTENKEPIYGLSGLDNILISDEFDEIQVACIAHSFIETYLTPYQQEQFKYMYGSKHYEKIPGLLLEKLALAECQDEMFQKDILERLERQKVLEVQNAIIRHESMDYDDLISKIKTDLKNHPEIIELLNSDKYRNILENGKNALLDWVTHETFSQLVGDVYTTRLLEIYKDDKDEMRHILREILKGKKSLIELFLNYNLSLTDNETILTYEKKINRIIN